MLVICSASPSRIANSSAHRSTRPESMDRQESYGPRHAPAIEREVVAGGRANRSLDIHFHPVDDGDKLRLRRSKLWVASRSAQHDGMLRLTCEELIDLRRQDSSCASF